MHTHSTHISEHRCWKCHQVFDARIKRSAIFKAFFFWLPVRIYFCAKCARRRYVIQHREDDRTLSPS